VQVLWIKLLQRHITVIKSFYLSNWCTIRLF